MSGHKKVVMYGNTTCPYCGAARMLLTKKAVAFDEIIITNDDQKREEMLTRSGNRTVPQIFIEDTLVGGFDELYALDKSGKLDTLLAIDEAGN